MAPSSVATLRGSTIPVHISSYEEWDSGLTTRFSAETTLIVKRSGVKSCGEAAFPFQRNPVPGIVAPTATTNIAETIPSDGSGSSPSKDAKFYLERGIASYRDGDLPVAIADFDLAIEGDPNLKDAYIDQGIAWYRMSNFHRAFDVIAQAARIKFAPSLRLHRSRRRRSVK